jgi:hypothetical protein
MSKIVINPNFSAPYEFRTYHIYMAEKVQFYTI